MTLCNLKKIKKELMNKNIRNIRREEINEKKKIKNKKNDSIYLSRISIVLTASVLHNVNLQPSLFSEGISVTFKRQSFLFEKVKRKLVSKSPRA